METVILAGGQRFLAHDEGDCIGEFCCIHNPSDHHMKDWPQFWRADKGVMERLCEHGIGHPDPDDLLISGPVEGRSQWASIHGCDGCCRG